MIFSFPRRFLNDRLSYLWQSSGVNAYSGHHHHHYAPQTFPSNNDFFYHRYISDSPNSAVDKTMPTEAYTLVEANVTAQLSREYLAVLRIDDALDVRPETRTGFRTAGRVVTFVFQGTWQ